MNISLELSFMKGSVAHSELSKVMRMDESAENNRFLVEFHSLADLWNKPRKWPSGLKQILFYNGRSAMQKPAGHWLLPIDLFGMPKPEGAFYLTTHENISVLEVDSWEQFVTLSSNQLQPNCHKSTTNEVTTEMTTIAVANTTNQTKTQTTPTTTTTAIETSTTTWVEPETVCDNRHKSDSVKEADVAAAKIEHWPLPIHYTIERTTSSHLRAKVREAIKRIEERTCVRFKEEITGIHLPFMNLPYLVFGTDQSCLSMIGRFVAIGPQMISVGGKNAKVGTVLHMLLHALGIPHENLREDRDEMVQINWENVLAEEKRNFEMIKSDQHKLPYDFGSIMHDGPNEFSKEKDAITIITKPPEFQHTIGQRAEMSFKDVQLVNRIYCEECATSESAQCLNGGYPNPNAKCATCICPAPFQGELCDRDECDEMYASTFIQIENDTDIMLESTESERIKCTKFINNWFDRKFVIEIKDVELTAAAADGHQKCDDNMICEHTYVEAKHGSNMTVTGPRVCCKEALKKKPFKIGMEIRPLLGPFPQQEERYVVYLLVKGKIRVTVGVAFGDSLG